MAPARQPKGIREGGQFKTSAHSESFVSLIDPTQVQRSAWHWAPKYQVEADDVVQESWLSFLKNSYPAEIHNMGGYVHRAVRMAAARISGLGRFEDRQAHGELAVALDEFAQRHHREASGREREAIAIGIENAREPKRRPTNGWYKRRGDVSLDALDLDAGDGTGGSGRLDQIVSDARERYDGAAPCVRDFAGDTIAAEIDGMLDGSRPAAAKARRLAWAALAEQRDVTVPMPVEDSIPEDRARKHRRLLDRGGGVIAACRSWRNEDLTGEQAAALFSPFTGQRNLTLREQEQIVGLIERAERISGHGESLWRGALLVAQCRSLVGARRTAGGGG